MYPWLFNVYMDCVVQEANAMVPAESAGTERACERRQVWDKPAITIIIKNVGNARPVESDWYPNSPKTPASNYQAIEEKKKGKTV